MKVGREIRDAVNKIFKDKYNNEHLITNFSTSYLNDNIDEPVIIFMIKDKEKENFNKTMSDHDCKYMKDPHAAGAFGANLSFAFEPNTVGMRIVIKCECGMNADIIDYDCWWGLF